MSTQTLYQGSLRPTLIPAITMVHPGLQVHSIPAPRTDRRLSFLMSATLYCAFAAGAVVVAQATPAIKNQILKTEREPPVVDLMSLGAPPRLIAAVAPTPTTNFPPQSAVIPTITEHPPIGVPETPKSIGTNDVSDRIASSSVPSIGPGNNLVTGTPTGRGPLDSPASQPIEMSANAVSILHQIRPVYPSLARVAHKEGDVVLIMTINEQGIPTDVKVDSGDAIFRGDAIRAAQQWRFTPARFDGQPHSARFRLTLQFRLRG